MQCHVPASTPYAIPDDLSGYIAIGLGGGSLQATNVIGFSTYSRGMDHPQHLFEDDSFFYMNGEIKEKRS